MKDMNVAYSATFMGPWNIPVTLVVERKLVSHYGSNSPRVNGRLVLRTNSFHLYRVSEHAALNSYSTRYVDYVDDNENIVYGYNNNPSAVFNFQPEIKELPEDILPECHARFLRKASSIQANLALMYAERTKTSNMVVNAMKTIAAAASHLRRGRFSQAAKALGVSGNQDPAKDLAQQWLQLQYGWRPLLSEVYNACNYKPPVQKTISATYTRTERSPVVTGQSDPFGWSKTRQVTYRTSMRGTIKVNNSSVAAASSLGLTNPSLIAWELVPYSFIADWFIPVGDYLTRLHALDGLELFDECTTLALTNDCQTHFYQVPTNDNPAVSSVTGGTATYQSYKKDRYPFIPNSVPLPVPKNPFSVLHIANALALLTTAFRR